MCVSEEVACATPKVGCICMLKRTYFKVKNVCIYLFISSLHYRALKIMTFKFNRSVILCCQFIPALALALGLGLDSRLDLCTNIFACI